MNIVFDLGKVLIDFRPEVYLKYLGYNNYQINHFSNIIFYGKEWDKYNSSQYDLNQTKYELIKNHPNFANDIEKIFKYIDFKYILFEMKDTSSYLIELKNKGHNIYILSDLSEECYEYNQKFNFFNYIDGGVYSFEIHSTKPNSKNFEVLLDKFNLIPEETIFIDDRQTNIDASNRVGIKGILFTTLQEVKEKVKLYTC